MILKEAERKVGKSDKDGFTFPIYDGYSLANVPNTAMKIVGIKPIGPVLDSSITDKIDTSNIRKVVILLIDGFGYPMFLKSLKYASFFRKIAEKGIACPITCGFPSTTAASITTMNTAKTPQEHGVIEWTLYLNEIGQVVNTLPFTSIEDVHLKGKYSPKILYNGITVYDNAIKANVKAYTLLDAQLEKSAYNQLFKSKKISEVHIKNSDFAIKLRKILESEKGKSYVYSYLASVDTTTHVHGPHTEESEAEILAVSQTLEEGLLRKINKKTASETLLIITADHGHTSIDPRKTIYLDKYKQLEEYYQCAPDGKIIPPTGGPRDVFLHIKPEKLEEAYSFLSKKLSKTAKVIKTKDVISKGLFGNGKPNKKFKSRAGDILILPYKGNSVWYHHLNGHKFDKLGVHGGLTKDEMLIPFAAARISDLL